MAWGVANQQGEINRVGAPAPVPPVVSENSAYADAMAEMNAAIDTAATAGHNVAGSSIVPSISLSYTPAEDAIEAVIGRHGN